MSQAGNDVAEAFTLPCLQTSLRKMIHQHIFTSMYIHALYGVSATRNRIAIIVASEARKTAGGKCHASV